MKCVPRVFDLSPSAVILFECPKWLNASLRTTSGVEKMDLRTEDDEGNGLDSLVDSWFMKKRILGIFVKCVRDF